MPFTALFSAIIATIYFALVEDLPPHKKKLKDVIIIEPSECSKYFLLKRTKLDRDGRFFYFF